MEKLESLLDIEVETYLRRVKDKEEIKNLVSGNLTRKTYARFLFTFYIIEFLSQRAVNMASINTKDSDPYLSKRFHSCAQGELGHAEIALRDLKDLGEKEINPFCLEIVREYDEFLQNAAEQFPLAILGHSYLFENVSGLLFPEVETVPDPSTFIEVHAKEDPAHSLAIKKTVRRIEKDLGKEKIEKIVQFSRESGDYLMRLFDSLA
ncbi:MAG: iron-containing redox enzyme family protein [Candidatus Dadabacteria bacterium]|nr:iron-containing redox enzyme family protein [Candidatus Dadabacteria bacterium]